MEDDVEEHAVNRYDAAAEFFDVDRVGPNDDVQILGKARNSEQQSQYQYTHCDLRLRQRSDKNQPFHRASNQSTNSDTIVDRLSQLTIWRLRDTLESHLE